MPTSTPASPAAGRQPVCTAITSASSVPSQQTCASASEDGDRDCQVCSSFTDMSSPAAAAATRPARGPASAMPSRRVRATTSSTPMSPQIGVTSSSPR